jgi:sugar transferase (PEP-CTERM/EpsH1 system associated)
MSRRLKVLHIVFKLGAGGLENGVVNLCNYLDHDRFAPSICVFHGGGNLESRVDTSRVDLFEIKQYWCYDATLPFRVAKEIHRRKFDIVHTHSWGTLVEGLGGALMAKTPIVIHGEHGLLEKRSRSILLQRWLWSKADVVIAVAEELAERIAKVVGFPRTRIHVIPNGVDTQRFQPAENGRGLQRLQFGLPPTKVLLGMVARLVSVKNHLGVFHALAQLRSQGIDASLVLAGDGPLQEFLYHTAQNLHLSDYVHFLGAVMNIEKVYQAIDIFVLNSTSEGMSNTILEAMACGLPVVATDVGANPQLVCDGQSGILVKSEDTNSLSQALCTLIKDAQLRNQMGEKGRCRVETNFSIKRMVQNYADFYIELSKAAKLN